MAGVSYAAFFAPGLLAAAAMQTAFLESSGQVARAAAPSGAYQSTVATPLSPEQVMAGHMLYVTFRVLTSSAAFILVMTGFGLVSGARGVAVLIAATLTGLAFATPAAAWSVGVRTQRHIYNVFRMMIMPLYMFSGTFFASPCCRAPSGSSSRRCPWPRASRCAAPLRWGSRVRLPSPPTPPTCAP